MLSEGDQDVDGVDPQFTTLREQQLEEQVSELRNIIQQTENHVQTLQTQLVECQQKKDQQADELKLANRKINSCKAAINKSQTIQCLTDLNMKLDERQGKNL